MTHCVRGCPFITNVDGEDFVIDGFMKYDGYGDECKELYFAGVAIFQDVKNVDSNRKIILFSPAAASFDNFKNFEDRGKYFNNLIKRLKNV